MPPDNLRQRGIQIFRPIVYGNMARILTPEESQAITRQQRHPLPDGWKDHTHQWTVALRGAASSPDSDIVGGVDDLTHFIKRVTIKIHESFPNSSRVFDKPPYEVTETGWGEFEIQIRIAFVPESGEKPITLFHTLKLHNLAVTQQITDNPTLNPTPDPIQSWQYDEIVFADPYEHFLNILTSRMPMPLPPPRGLPVPAHPAYPSSLPAPAPGLPEFHNQLAQEEAERIRAALNKVQIQIQETRQLTEQMEKETAVLRAQPGSSV